MSAGSVKSKCQTVNHNARPCYQTAKQRNQKKVPPKMKMIQRAPIGAKISDFMRNPVLGAQRNSWECNVFCEVMRDMGKGKTYLSQTH